MFRCSRCCSAHICLLKLWVNTPPLTAQGCIIRREDHGEKRVDERSKHPCCARFSCVFVHTLWLQDPDTHELVLSERGKRVADLNTTVAKILTKNCEFMFEVDSPGRHLFLRAGYERELDRWVAGLQILSGLPCNVPWPEEYGTCCWPHRTGILMTAALWWLRCRSRTPHPPLCSEKPRAWYCVTVRPQVVLCIAPGGAER